jgi:DNA-binding transcriptional LysR family regulator
MKTTATNWDDFYIAYQVAEQGSLSKAGKALNLNHATVLRHVNRLEEQLGSKLFIRHQRGYRLTDAGELLIAEMPNIMTQFNRLKSLIAETEKSIVGQLTITTANDNINLFTPPIMAFKNLHPNLRINMVASDDVLSLATGAAHVSLRAGREPQDPDLIVRKMIDIRFNFYASSDYIERYGEIKNLNEVNQHYWVLPNGEKQNIPLVKKVLSLTEDNQIVFQANNFLDIYNAIEHGLGIGPMPNHLASNYKNVKEVIPSEYISDIGLWFVYHRDLKENAKVKAFYDFLMQRF